MQAVGRIEARVKRPWTRGELLLASLRLKLLQLGVAGPVHTQALQHCCHASGYPNFCGSQHPLCSRSG